MQPEDLMLLTDFYEYTMAYAYFKENKHEEIAYFDMFVRTIPDGGGFLILNGLQPVHRFCSAFSLHRRQNRLSAADRLL